MEQKKINILGTEYMIREGTCEEYPVLKEMDGYTDTSAHLIVVDDMSVTASEVDAKKDLQTYKKCVLRHEITHAFLNESGLANNSHPSKSWAINEEMVDWFAIQSPKIFKVFQELDIL